MAVSRSAPDYARVSTSSPWKAFPGRYTREGDVRALLTRTDDMFVVSQPGDEIALSFDAAARRPFAPAGADVPAPCGRLQQGDEHPLGHARTRWGRCRFMR